LGYKVILQQIAKEEPSVCGNSLARSVMLRNSYQNKPQIGLTILWVLGQGGFHNVSVGLKVWHDIMLPVLDSKHYATFVGDYLYRILKNYSMNPYK
jgi:TMEM214, C-terminal, caspase 4 activator